MHVIRRILANKNQIGYKGECMSNKTIKHKKDYREKDVFGMMANGVSIKPCQVVVRMTNDRIGQSLSLQAGNTMIQIPLEQVQDIIKVVDK